MLMTTQELTKAVVENTADIARNDERLDMLHEQVGKILTRQEEYGRMLAGIKELAIAMSNMCEKLGDLTRKVETIGDRVGDIEQKPAKRWDTFIMALTASLVGGVVGYLISAFLK